MGEAPCRLRPSVLAPSLLGSGRVLLKGAIESANNEET